MESEREQYTRLVRENSRLRQELNQTTARLEELESTVGAIREGLIDAVVVYQDSAPEVWSLEPADRLRLRMVLQAAKAGTWEWDVDRGTVAWSDSLGAIFGLAQASEHRRHVGTSAIHDADRERVLARLQRISAGGEDFYDEFRIVRDDGSTRWLAAKGQVVRDVDGRPNRLVGIHLDITDRCKLEEDLRQEESNKNAFLATLAHELRNPFAAISNAIRISRVAGLDERDRRWTEEIIDRQMQQLGRLMDDLLDLSRIAQGKLDLHMQAVALAEVIDSSARSVRPAFEKAGCNLAIAAASVSPTVWGDPGRLQQLFSNLLTNAARYNKPDGNVVLEATQEGDQAVISIRDTGIGIAPELLPRVFGLFVQGSSSSTDRGLGIGLSLVRSIAELHGGTVEAKSAGIGLGAEFIVRLPVISPTDQAIEPALNEGSADRISLRILIVDDNQDAAQTTSFLLVHLGHRTAVAGNAEQALELARTFSPQVALLDIGLPGMDGRLLARELRRRDPGIRLVAVSGFGGEEEKRESLDCGFHEHLVKPVTAEEILHAIGGAPRRP